MCRRLLMISALILLVIANILPAQQAAVERVDFTKQVQPIFKQFCYRCHGAEKQKSGLRLDQRKAAIQGGDDGVVIVVGKSGESNLYRYIAGLDAEKIMPPSGPKPSGEQIELIKKW